MSLQLDAASESSSSRTHQIVSFKVDGRAFGVPVDQVREIKGWQPTTPLPDCPPSVLGVINLRGQVIPVYDLHMRLGLGASERSRASVIIVVDHGDRQIGILADSVSDILNLSDEDVRPSPTPSERQSDLVASLFVRENEVIPLLRIPAIAGE